VGAYPPHFDLRLVLSVLLPKKSNLRYIVSGD